MKGRFGSSICKLTLMLLVANLANTKYKMMQKPGKCLKPRHMGTHLRVLGILSKSYLMNTNMTRSEFFFLTLAFLGMILSVVSGESHFQRRTEFTETKQLMRYEFQTNFVVFSKAVY